MQTTPIVRGPLLSLMYNCSKAISVGERAPIVQACCDRKNVWGSIRSIIGLQNVLCKVNFSEQRSNTEVSSYKTLKVLRNHNDAWSGKERISESLCITRRCFSMHQLLPVGTTSFMFKAQGCRHSRKSTDGHAELGPMIDRMWKRKIKGRDRRRSLCCTRSIVITEATNVASNDFSGHHCI